jgi:hypothetical protein
LIIKRAAGFVYRAGRPDEAGPRGRRARARCILTARPDPQGGCLRCGRQRRRKADPGPRELLRGLADNVRRLYNLLCVGLSRFRDFLAIFYPAKYATVLDSVFRDIL